jgi:hypothetical protein
MLTVTYAECHSKAPCDECRYAQCSYTECRGAGYNIYSKVEQPTMFRLKSIFYLGTTMP